MKKLIIASAVSALLLGAAPATWAANSFSFSDLTGAEYDTAGVYVKGKYSFTGDTDDGGGLDEVIFQLWDDGVQKFTQTSSVSLLSSGTFSFEVWYSGLVGTSAPGVGLVLVDNGGYELVIDPYYVPHYADPSDCEVDCGPVETPEPGTVALLGLGLGLLGVTRRRRQSV